MARTKYRVTVAFSVAGLGGDNLSIEFDDEREARDYFQKEVKDWSHLGACTIKLWKVVETELEGHAQGPRRRNSAD